MNTVTADIASSGPEVSAAKPVSALPLAFIDGVCDDDGLLRHHILAPVKKALVPQVAWRDVGRQEEATRGVVRVSLFPNVPGDVLLMFDLADRNHFRQFADDGRPFVRDFRKILVPGTWLRRQLLNDRSMHLQEAQVVAAGAPRVDYLRALIAAQPPKAADAPLTVLFAPMHDNWTDNAGQPMSIRMAMEPYLDALRARATLTEAVDGRNKDYKRPITKELLAADIVITDYTSVIYEAWALGKPVIFPRWLTGERIIEKAPNCAEAQIYRERIGHHADSYEDLIALLAEGRGLRLGDGVDAFMADYLDNWHGKTAADNIARILERQADPEREMLDRKARQDLEVAVKARDWAAAEQLLSNLLRWNPKEAGLYGLFARAMNAQGKWWQELDALEKAVVLSLNSPELLTRLGDARMRMGRNRAAAEAYREAIGLAPTKATADLHYKLGFAHEAPGHDGPPDLRRAADAYKAACAMDPNSTAARVGEGALHTASGRWKEAQSAFRARLVSDPLNADLHQRLGMAHDRCYEWSDAEASYVRALALDPSKATWHYRLGFVRERQKKYDEAATAYLHAASLSETHQSDWFYRAGYVLEKAGRLDDACRAFSAVEPETVLPVSVNPYLEAFRAQHAQMVSAQLERRPKDAALWNTYSTLAEGAGDLKSAAKAAAEAVILAPTPTKAYIDRQSALEGKLRQRRVIEARLHHDCTRPQEWLEYSKTLETHWQLDAAIDAMQQAVLRSNDHMPAWHHRLGILLMRVGRLAEACAAFRDQKILQRPHGIWEDKFKADQKVRFHATLREFFDLQELQENSILYEVHTGHSFGCNPKAIFEKLLADPEHTKKQHFWVLDDPQFLPDRYRKFPNVFVVKRGSELYLKLITSCKYLINNGTFPEWFVRKPGQVYLNTWHGTPLKALGSDMKLPLVARANTSRNYVQATHMIFPNEHTRRVQIDRHNVRSLARCKQLVSGYPRNDQLVRKNPAVRDELCRILGIPADKPIVLYAPTYRGSWNTPELEADSFSDVIGGLNDPGYSLLFRGHHLIEAAVSQIDDTVTVVPQSIDTNELLSAVDVLVSDFSSIIYDFAVTGRPIILHTPDWDNYAEERGLYFSKQDLPWPKTETSEDLQKLVLSAIANPKDFLTDSYKATQREFCPFDDGNATDRVISFIFNSSKDEGQTSGIDYSLSGIAIRSALGTINGIASSAVALINNLGHAGIPTVLLLDAQEIKKGETGDDLLRDLEGVTSIIFSTGTLSMSLEEQWLYTKFTFNSLVESDLMLETLLQGFRYESARLVGSLQFRRVVDHQGYHPMWSCILNAMPAAARAIYLHNDMVSESESRLYPNLRRVFRLYERFDSLISVSPSSLEENRSNLERDYPKTKGRHHCVHNGLTASSLNEKSLLNDPEDSELQIFLRDTRFKIINLARLWPEKNQEQLIEAIDILIKRGHNPLLYIVGEGPLRFHLEALVEKKRLNDSIRLIGVRRNPFPFLRAADCHVLSSNYEGQGIVLLEAMTLGVPCVSTNIPGPQSVLADGLGLLTDLTPEALADGIEKISTGAFVPRPFDAEAYNAKALNEFLIAVGLSGLAT